MGQIIENKKRRFNSKGKGNGFESQIAKKLSAALNPLKFIRTQGSGARVGGKNFETIGQMFGEDALKLFVGDVVPVNEKESGVTFNFSVECKFYKTPDGFTSLVSGTSNVFKWMQEAIDDASKIDRVPLLIFKWNNTQIFVARCHDDMEPKPKLVLTQNNLSIDIFCLDDLLPIREFWITERS
jgi:hypothetical protein